MQKVHLQQMICCLKMIYLHLQDVQLGKNSVQDVEREWTFKLIFDSM